MSATSQELNLSKFHDAGSIVEHYVYSPFGKILKIENAAGADITATPMINNFYAFTGREYDKESGLYYYRARYYESETGRFIQSDPYSGATRAPSSFNSKYIYAANSPAMYRDPSGKFIPILVAIAISALIGGAISANNGQGFWHGALIGAASAGIVMGGAAFAMWAIPGAAAGGAAGFGAGVLGGGIAGAIKGDILHGIGLSKDKPTGRDRFVGALFGASAGGFIGVNGMQGLTGDYGAKDIGGSIHDVNTGTAEGFYPADQPISDVSIQTDFGPAANSLFRDLQNINLNINTNPGVSTAPPLY